MGQEKLEIVLARSPLIVMRGVKQKVRLSADTNVADAEEERARRLAMSVHSKQLAALVVLLDYGLEARIRAPCSYPTEEPAANAPAGKSTNNIARYRLI